MDPAVNELAQFNSRVAHAFRVTCGGLADMSDMAYDIGEADVFDSQYENILI